MAEVVKRLASRGVSHPPDIPTLSLRDVSVAFMPGAHGVTSARANQYALQDISFDLHRGQRIAIVGPNGAGKTTLLRLVVGTLKPTQGALNVYGYGPDDHTCIAYVPQRNQIDWSFPAAVEDVVMMGRVRKIGLFRWPSRRDWQVVRNALARVHASHLAHRQIGELSGGQQQRVFIARALAQEAELLLMDEPLTGLDVPSQEAIFEILDNVRADDVTVLLTTHDLDLAAERFDYVMLLNRRMVAFGPPSEVLTPAHLREAYGGHLHVLGEEGLFLADSCCGHGEEL